jgi:hypothetical protein
MAQSQYFRFSTSSSLDPQLQQQMQMISKTDFDQQSLDIIPVADPTMCSEAHKYARLQAIIQVSQVPSLAQEMNAQQALLTLFTDLQYPNPQKYVGNPNANKPDPKMLDLQLKNKVADNDQHDKELKSVLAAHKIDQHQQVIDIQKKEAGIKQDTSTANTARVILDAHKADTDTAIKVHNTKIQQQLANTNDKKVSILGSKQGPTKGTPNSGF